jgi:hypothetical protein
MPFVESSDVALHALDEGLCGVQLMDALCCVQPEVLEVIFKSGLAASQHAECTGATGVKYCIDVCEPWPNFLIRDTFRVSHRSPIINASCEAAATAAACAFDSSLEHQPSVFAQLLKNRNRSLDVQQELELDFKLSVQPEPPELSASSELSIAESAAAAVTDTSVNLDFNPQDASVDPKMRQEWQDCLSTALFAVGARSSALMSAFASDGAVRIDERKALLEGFIDCAQKSLMQFMWHRGRELVPLQEKVSTFVKVCEYVLRTLPFLPVLLKMQSKALPSSSSPPTQVSVLWFGNTTPWEKNLEQDKEVLRLGGGQGQGSRCFYHGTKGFAVYRCMHRIY